MRLRRRETPPEVRRGDTVHRTHIVDSPLIGDLMICHIAVVVDIQPSEGGLADLFVLDDHACKTAWLTDVRDDPTGRHPNTWHRREGCRR